VWNGQQPDAFQKELGELRENLENRSRTLGEMAEAAARVAEEDRVRIVNLDRTLSPLAEPRDTARMWTDLVGPIVQLAGDTTVGSGVLLASRPAGEGKWRTHVLTAWHVVRDIYGSPDNTAAPVPVKLYLPDGSSKNETAHLVAHDVELDLALLAMDSDELVPFGARLATRTHLADVRIFDPIYAVGCPLGNDPIPTAGEIASTHHEVDGGHYWMISAPTYVGNSGGGIFDARTHELLGIFSKIYTHGALRTTIVPHMGLATPLSTVYRWLDGTEFAYLEAPDVAQTQTASAKH
jgi:S1-C subfamily serine protease